MFDLNYKQKFEIQTGGDEETPVYSRLAVGITTAEPDNNEETDQTPYYDGEGFNETDVISAQLVISFSGHRDYEDEAQNYIFDKAIAIGPARRTNFRWTLPDGAMYEGDCTLAAISGPGGDAAAKSDISFEIHFNGQPTYTPPTP
ncbi:phage tail tube protein [Virgibacillus sp. Bac332]|uniref:phage tail tube protein n=1 Tax=Virgibacillus sp. Bac332 TaxID=2419842 RepID=UPI000EF4CBD3|nr:capsid protein [Virgibacillus sp. Bac332]